MNNIIVVFSNRKSGWLQMQVYLRDVSENAAFKLVTNLTCAPYNEKNNIYKLSADEMSLVRTIHHTSDNCISKKLAKGTTVEDIYNDITKPDKAKNPALKHFLEQLMENNQKAVSKLQQQNSVPVFYNFSSITSLFDDDAVIVEPELSKPVYEITFEEEQVIYRINLYHKGKPIEIQYRNRFINFLPTNPTTFIVAKKLYRLDGCNYRQIEPFTQRNTSITLPKTVLSTNNNFIVRTIRDFEVIAKGFEVKVVDILPKVRLYLNNDLSLLPNISMEFDYNGNIALPTSQEMVFVSQSIDQNGQYTYTKTLRNNDFEQQKTEVLTDLDLVENTTTFSVNKFLMIPNSAKDNQDVKSRLFDIIGWINFNFEVLQLHGFEIDSSLNDQAYFIGKFNIQASANEQLDWFDMNAIITIGEFEYPFIRFKNHILNHIIEFELPNKQIFIIPNEWFTRFHDLLYYSLEVDDKLQFRKGMNHLFREAFKNDVLNFSDEDNLKQIDLEMVLSPSELQGSLRDYQKFGYQWLLNLQKNNLGGILADDMGLGKTVQIISLLLSGYNSETAVLSETSTLTPFTTNEGQLDLFDASAISMPSTFNSTGIAPSLIVMPTSLIFNWKSEIEKFAPSLKVYVFQDKNRLKEHNISILSKYHIVLISYGIMQNYIQELSHFHFNNVILDESQLIKNPTSKRYRAVGQLKSNFRIAMSGTPIENSLADLWAQMDFVNPGLLKSLKSFRYRYINPIEKQVSKDSQTEEEKLFNIIDPFILRRTKEMVAKELPPMTIQTLYCDMSEAQQLFYEKARAAIRTKYLEEIQFKNAKRGTAEALKAITRLRQIANHPRLVDAEYSENSGKFDEVMAALETVIDENHNVLIFSQFARHLAIFEQVVIEKGWSYAKLTGATLDREEQVRKFTKDDDCRIFFITTKSGGTGLNLTKADYVFMLDPWWNEAAENQAFCRAHRIGQDKSVFVYRFITTQTIEQKMTELKDRKSSTANKFIREHNQLGTITEEDMDDLLSE